MKTNFHDIFMMFLSLFCNFFPSVQRFEVLAEQFILRNTREDKRSLVLYLCQQGNTNMQGEF